MRPHFFHNGSGLVVYLNELVGNRHSVLTETRTKCGWTHSFQCSSAPHESQWVATVSVTEDAILLMQSLLDAGYDPYYGRSVEVGSASKSRWSIFVHGDTDVVAAACAAAGEWIRGGGL